MGKIKIAKYKNTNIQIDGIKFDSKKEAARYSALKTMEKSGEISDLKTQVAFSLIPKQKKKNGEIEREVKYIADFVYNKNGERVIEDVKSSMTRKLPAYIIKRKLMLFIHSIEIKET